MSFKNEELLHCFQGFHHPVAAIIRSTPPGRIIWNDIIDLKPLKKFAFGNILLMGDAAHATTPNMGQGACMAIEDAAVLMQCMEQNRSVHTAFMQFEKKRLARTTTIVKNSWTLGRIAQLENKFLIALRNSLVRHTPPSAT